MDKFRIDSHKMMYHVERLDEWLTKGDVYPVYMELSPAGACNHRCTFCGLDFMEYRNVFLETEVLKKRLTEMGKLGVRSIMYAGEGEPLLHKDMAEITNHTKEAGIDVAFTTNAVPMTEKFIKQCIKSITWIKISINGGTPETYAKIHQCNPSDFDKVIKNTKFAVEYKKSKGIDTAIGMQLILLPENAGEAEEMARVAKDAGCDYLVIKSYSQHLMSEDKTYKDFSYDDQIALGKKLKAFDDDDFKVIFRSRAMEKLGEEDRGYSKCLALPFWAYIDSDGGVWGCSAYLGDDRFRYGSIYENTFEEIWTSDKRKKNLEYVKNDLDPCECRKNCRMDEVNRYLQDLTNPPGHVNFI